MCLAVIGATACDPPPVPTPGRTVGSLGGSPSHVALTFDDGPDPSWTPQVLDILDRYGIKATFFVTGANAQRYPHLVRDIVARGNSIGDHTWSHARLTRLADNEMRDQVAATSNVVREVTTGVGPYRTGYIVSCTRPPYGSTNARVNETIASLGMRPALWSVETNDYRGADPLAAVARYARNDSVVLMHDGGGNRARTVARLPAVIENLQARGFALTRVCDSRPQPEEAPAG